MESGKMKYGLLQSGVTVVSLLFFSLAAAADKVVVIPLFSSGSGDNIPTVTSAGQVWMDRNLGAIRVAGSTSDSLAYGWLYQWGRSADGHESRSSPINSTTQIDDPNAGFFISGYTDWRITPDSNLWSSESSPNNPCPAGFRLPIESEWETERASWGSNNAAGAFASPLKLVVAGFRGRGGGAIGSSGSHGFYWSGSVDGSRFGRNLSFFSVSAYMSSYYRANGFSVRCIKD